MGNHESRSAQVSNILAPTSVKGQTQRNKDSSEWGEQDKKKPVTFQNLKLREFEAGVCIIR